MREKGTHTWDLHLAYHRCPKCGNIFESRKDYVYQMGKFVKDLQCPKCGNTYTLTKAEPPRIGPFFGETPKPDFDWSNNERK